MSKFFSRPRQGKLNPVCRKAIYVSGNRHGSEMISRAALFGGVEIFEFSKKSSILIFEVKSISNFPGGR